MRVVLRSTMGDVYGPIDDTPNDILKKPVVCPTMQYDYVLGLPRRLGSLRVPSRATTGGGRERLCAP
jgi:hypothetical protein